MVTGILLFAILVILGGAIAYIGDGVGRRVGKRRIMIFGLRPKHTSVIVTIGTGFVIAALTLVALLVISTQVRTAFFGLERLLKELKTVRGLHDDVKRSFVQTQKRVVEAQKNLDRTQKNLDLKSREVERMKTDAEKLAKNVAELEKQGDKLEAENQKLQKTKKRLEKDVSDGARLLNDTTKTCLYGEVLYTKNQALARMVVPGETGMQSLMDQLDKVADNLFKTAVSRGAAREEQLAALFDIQKKELVRALGETKGADLVEIRSATNVIKGEPLILKLLVVENRLVFKKGATVGEVRVRSGASRERIAADIEKAMLSVSAAARAEGIIPNSEDKVALVPYKKYSRLLETLENSKNDSVVKIVAEKDTYIADMLEVDFVTAGERRNR